MQHFCRFCGRHRDAGLFTRWVAQRVDMTVRRVRICDACFAQRQELKSAHGKEAQRRAREAERIEARQRWAQRMKRLRADEKENKNEP